MRALGRFYRSRSDQRGLVLVIVLWIVTLLAVMAGAFAYSMRIETRLATSAVERARARALAEAGVAYALAWQLNPETQKLWPPNGDPRDWEFGGGRVRIQVVDAAGLISLNTADADLLKALLAGVGVDPQDQDRLTGAIIDWRDQDDRPVPFGAEKDEYRAAGLPGPKNALFESIEELQQVLGMTKPIYQAIADKVTAFSNHYRVSAEWAPAQLLQTLGLNAQAVADYVGERTRAADDGSPPPPVPADSDHAFFSAGRSTVYHVTVVAETGTGAAMKITAVARVESTRPGQTGWRWLAWREGR